MISGQPFKTWSFFAVFDGHAGAACAKVSSTRLIEVILAQEAFKVSLSTQLDPVRSLGALFWEVERADSQEMKLAVEPTKRSPNII